MLLENIDDVKQVISISDATTFDRLFGHIVNAEQKYIFPIIGNELYGAIATFYNNPDSQLLKRSDMNPDFNSDFYIKVEDKDVAFARVLYLLQQTIIHLAFYEGFDLLNAYVSDSGFKRQEGDNFKSLFKYQEDNIRKYYRENGLNGLDRVLNFLEINIEHFPEYNELYLKSKGKIIPNARVFNDVYNIHGSHIIYLRLVQSMKTVEELELAPVIGGEAMKTIYTELQKPEPADKVVKILPYLRNVVAWYSVSMLVEESGADITDKGLFFEGLKGGISMNDVKMPTPDGVVKMLIARNKNIALNYMQILKRYLSENSSDWDDWENPRTIFVHRNNNGKKTFWA
jgi:hypothetical protein